jgi:hypothetical protein
MVLANLMCECIYVLADPMRKCIYVLANPMCIYTLCPTLCVSVYTYVRLALCTNAQPQWAMLLPVHTSVQE